MNPVLRAKSADDDDCLESLITCIASINCEGHFLDHLGRSQNEQAAIVRDFQNTLAGALASAFPHITWSLEHLQNDSSRDSIDLFGKGDSTVVIELDKHRADQVTKKFVSRSPMFKDQKIYYISLCFPARKE
jgi:hypothetical protein